MPAGKIGNGADAAKIPFYNKRFINTTATQASNVGNPAALKAITSMIDKQEHIETAARALKSIAHPLRLKILCVLGSDEVCVQDIVDAVGTSQSNISQHLAILRDKGVLLTRKDANRVYYRIGDARTLQLISLMREVFCEDSPQR